MKDVGVQYVVCYLRAKYPHDVELGIKLKLDKYTAYVCVGVSIHV